jgi:hypothetical protein
LNFNKIGNLNLNPALTKISSLSYAIGLIFHSSPFPPRAEANGQPPLVAVGLRIRLHKKHLYKNELCQQYPTLGVSLKPAPAIIKLWIAGI